MLYVRGRCVRSNSNSLQLAPFRSGPNFFAMGHVLAILSSTPTVPMHIYVCMYITVRGHYATASQYSFNLGETIKSFAFVVITAQRDRKASGSRQLITSKPSITLFNQIPSLFLTR